MLIDKEFIGAIIGPGGRLSSKFRRIPTFTVIIEGRRTRKTT
jgi:hypothetical protein